MNKKRAIAISHREEGKFEKQQSAGDSKVQFEVSRK
jgi:hypothetical protein